MKMLAAIAHKFFKYFFPLKIVTGVDNLDFTQRAVSRMLFTMESSFCALLSHLNYFISICTL